MFQKVKGLLAFFGPLECGCLFCKTVERFCNYGHSSLKTGGSSWSVPGIAGRRVWRLVLATLLPVRFSLGPLQSPLGR